MSPADPAPRPVPDAGDRPRRAALGLLARSAAAQLETLLPELPGHQVLRAAETGTVMVQGRAGGTGAPFNLGEMTVTRASVALAGTGTAGHGYVQGRDKAHALRAACIDALGQDDPAWRDRTLAPLRAAENAARATEAAEAARTRVAFFTLARGEDE